MKTRAERRLKSELDRCRTEARKLNLIFDEASAVEAKQKYLAAPEKFTPLEISLTRAGSVWIRQKRF